MNPFLYLRRFGRILLVAITFIELIKCLILPNTLDVLLLVGLLLLLISVMSGDGKSL